MSLSCKLNLMCFSYVYWCGFFFKIFKFLSNLHPAWGLNSQPQDLELHVPQTEPAAYPLNYFISTLLL